MGAVNSSKEGVWRSRLRRFRSSGMSVLQFCEVEGVSAPAFYQWRKRLGTAAVAQASPTFVPVRLAAPAAAVEIHLPNGARVCVPPGPQQADSLRVAIEAAGRLHGSSAAEADAC